MHRRAPFIWTDQQPIDESVTFVSLIRDGPIRRDDGKNRWYLFRRDFHLPAEPERGEASITVDGRYQLFINGTRVGRGPSRSSPAYQRYDTYDICSHLSSGPNTIGVLIHVYGCDTAWYEAATDYWQKVFGDGGLWFEADIHCKGDTITVLSDEEWKCLECRAWERDTPRSGWGQDFIEDFDANNMPVGWTETGFDLSGWGKTHVLSHITSRENLVVGFSPIEPFPALIRREIPHLAETEVLPKGIVAWYGASPESSLPLDRRIFDEQLTELPEGMAVNTECLLSKDEGYATIRTAPGIDVVLIIEFDKRHGGYPFIEVEAAGGEIIECAVAETIAGEYTGNNAEQPRLLRETHLDTAHLFRYTAKPGYQRFEKFEWAAVKYMQLVVRNAPKGLRLHLAGSMYTHYPVGYLGKFDCSDPFLSKLWDVGRYTTLQCTHDAWEDCPSREKRQWLGDGIVHYLISAAAFGPSTQPIDRQFLIQASESQRPDGLLQMFTPGDHHTNGIIIPDFNLHWICGAGHYFMHTGDSATIEEIYPSIQRSLAWFERQRGPNSLITNMPYWHFIEWAHVGRGGETGAINALYVGALKTSAKLAEYLGYGRMVQRYNTIAAEITDALNTRHWDAERGVYVDSVDPETGEQDARVSQQTNAACILWGIAPKARWQDIIGYITDPARLKLTFSPPMVMEDEPFDPASDVVRTNTYFSHFLYSALAKAGRFDLAIQQIRMFFTPMLETGTETLWESFTPGASLCHAFSASPVYQLSAHALGVAPVEPGFKKFGIAIQPADLDYARGVYPTVKGDISVSWEKKGSNLELALNIPPGTRCSILPPEEFVLPEEFTDGAGPGTHVITLSSSD